MSSLSSWTYSVAIVGASSGVVGALTPVGLVSPVGPVGPVGGVCGAVNNINRISNILFVASSDKL